MYAFKDNMAVGLKFSYGRSMLDLASADLGVASIEMNAADCYQIQHKYSAFGVFRAYIPFGNSKRVAMFADLHLGGSFKQGKAFNAGGSSIYGTYMHTSAIQLAVDPGFIAFLTDRLALEMNVGTVANCSEAVSHINRYGSHHSDCIVTSDSAAAAQFLKSVDSAAVYHNVSTRFTDGSEFGMGAEIGISTDKLHARGPMGLEELTTYKYEVTGDGVVRA
jgi:hypothetical protein